MDKSHYEEMVSALDSLEQGNDIQNKKVYLFGHCNATEELVDLLLVRGYRPIAILDNNRNKQGNTYKFVPIVPPQDILSNNDEQTIVCIVARAYAAMSDQLKRLGYKGKIRKLVDYNSYADYSLSDETIIRMRARAERGVKKLNGLSYKYPGYLKVLCPFQALGDIYFMMSYLMYFLKKRNVRACVVGVIGNACGQAARLFCPNENGMVEVDGTILECHIEIFSQKDMDEIIQGALYTQDENVYIPHQDRPYVVNLFKALYIKKIPLEQIYCCGVFGLSANTKPISPTGFVDYPNLKDIPKNKGVIISPYAKSVTELPIYVWEQIIAYYKSIGKECYTNVAGEEEPLAGTIAISPPINEIKSVVERAGTFIGLRSGMCDVLRTAKAEKIALFPDYYYCDTRWKAIDMYSIDGWKNMVVKDGFEWKRN